MHLYDDIGMHRRPFEGRHLVSILKQFLAYAEHIDWCYHSIHKHTSRSQHAPL